MLEHARATDDPIEAWSRLAENWRALPDGVDAVGPILKFIENNPSVDFGMPGPLVHFVEAYYGKGYERELLESVTRKPTSHSVWMLNRVVNGTKGTNEKTKLIEVLRNVKVHPLANSNTRELAERFLSRL